MNYSIVAACGTLVILCMGIHFPPLFSVAKVELGTRLLFQMVKQTLLFFPNISPASYLILCLIVMLRVCVYGVSVWCECMAGGGVGVCGLGDEKE